MTPNDKIIVLATEAYIILRELRHMKRRAYGSGRTYLVLSGLKCESVIVQPPGCARMVLRTFMDVSWSCSNS